MFWFALRSGYCSTTTFSLLNAPFSACCPAASSCIAAGSPGLAWAAAKPFIARAARRDDGLERLALVRHVRLGRLDQVGNQVETAPQLNIDLRERVFVRVAGADQAVVARR